MSRSTPNTALKFLQVAAGVVKNQEGKILIAKRDAALHQGGLWEFPGGKIEAGETPEQALRRELKEELDIDAEHAEPLITINHRYPDRAVTLRVFSVDRFTGAARGCQGQPIRWVWPNELGDFAFPAANHPIVTAARLPPYYAILDDQVSDDLMRDLRHLLAGGIKLIQARLKIAPRAEIAHFLEQAYPLCGERHARLLINSAVDFDAASVDGIHLTGGDLLALRARPSGCRWLSASCHGLAELEHAQKIGADFAVLAPVLKTLTHPDAAPLGWAEFARLAEQINIPIYALGGLHKEDLAAARAAGAQGVAGIRAFL